MLAGKVVLVACCKKKDGTVSLKRLTRARHKRETKTNHVVPKTYVTTKHTRKSPQRPDDPGLTQPSPSFSGHYHSTNKRPKDSLFESKLMIAYNCR